MKLIDRCISCKHLSRSTNFKNFSVKFDYCERHVSNNVDKMVDFCESTIINPEEFGCIFWEDKEK